MKIRQINIVLLLYLLLMGASNGQGQNAKTQIEGGINELKQTLSQMKVEETQSQGYLRFINRAADALQSDNPYLSLVYLQQAWMVTRPDRFSLTKADVAKQGMAGFDKEWKRVADEMTSKERLLGVKPTLRQPAAVHALIETALTLTHPYHQSSRLYAVNADVGEALIYLGRAEAAMDFAVFCKGLQLPATGRFIRLGSIESELKELESRIVAAYKQPDAANKQRAFIQISVTLKTAEELNRERRFGGALVKYLDALLELTVQESPAPDAQSLTALKLQNETLHKRLSASGTDASIGLIYVEMADFLLGHSSDNPDNLKRAAAVIEKVLPAYFKISAKEK